MRDRVLTDELREEMAMILAAMVVEITQRGVPPSAAIELALQQIEELLGGGK